MQKVKQKHVVLLITASTPSDRWIALRQHLANQWDIGLLEIRIITVDASDTEPSKYVTLERSWVFADGDVGTVADPREWQQNWYMREVRVPVAQGERAKKSIPIFHCKIKPNRR